MFCDGNTACFFLTLIGFFCGAYVVVYILLKLLGAALIHMEDNSGNISQDDIRDIPDLTSMINQLRMMNPDTPEYRSLDLKYHEAKVKYDQRNYNRLRNMSYSDQREEFQNYEHQLEQAWKRLWESEHSLDEYRKGR